MFPASDYDTRHTTSGNFPAGAAAAPGAAGTLVEEGSSAVLTHGAVGESFVQINTVLSCDAVAMYERGRPMLGAHATSRTQS